MFSRTTIASSISRPTHRISAISVMMLIVKPNASMNRKVPISEIGSVRPVITVERHEFRNRNTMPIVSSAPSNSVRCTFFDRHADRARVVAHHVERHAGGQLGAELVGHPVQAVDDADRVLALRLQYVERQRALAVVEA